MKNENLNLTQRIMLYLKEIMDNKKVDIDQQLPSEHFLMEKFYCSRLTVVQVYNKLKSLGAVYTKPKKGYFVARNYHNLIKPISGSIKYNKTNILNKSNYENTWFKDYEIKFDYGFNAFTKQYFNDLEMIMEADYFISKKYNQSTNIEFEQNIIEYLVGKILVLNNVVYHLQYEDNNLWEYKKIVVIYMYGYDEEGIIIAAKYKIKPEHFKFSKQEFSLF
ncbi:GntR family transcriptional regulator [Mycoplasma iguanae]|uniref:GntR family transcriptional regulator n=1 Tax=Mycoplasma iguanae TaxID=292461 RepID=A0ABY5RA87_9MOLU|nr:GntR family transcriptional regulator [Mycoplasma iguanae]UVD81905.1 GntR family transcriptional regulator [Mycoplasma iguanae]